MTASPFDLLDGLAADDARHWLDRAEPIELRAGETLFHEGDHGDSVFLVAAGTLEVVRDDGDLVLACIGPGAQVGAMAVVDGQPRSATVRTATDASLLRLPGALFAPDQPPPGQARVLVNLLREHARQMRAGNDRQSAELRRRLEAERSRVQLGVFVTQVIALMCIYGLTMNAGIALSERHGNSTVFSVACLLAFMLTLGWLMHRSGDPWSAWGVTWKGWLRAAGRGLLWTLPLIALSIPAKAALIALVHGWENEPLFVLPATLDTWSTSTLLLVAVYLLFVPVQEFAARAGLQGSLTRFLTGRHVRLRANVLANLMFAASHLHLGTATALLVIPPGLFWGWLMHREGNLWAPIVSHAVLGLWAFWVLGVPGV